MRLHLYWRDKTWKNKKSAAENVNLIIDTDRKLYKIYVNPYYDYRSVESIEVVKKSDILYYISHLKELRFKEDKQI